MEYFEILFGIASVILALYYYYTSTYTFWKSRGVSGPRPTFFFGNVKDATLLKESMTDLLTKLYKEYKSERLIGIFSRKTPVLILRDPDLIKDVLIKDFSKFTERGLNFSEKVRTYFELCYSKRDVFRESV